MIFHHHKTYSYKRKRSEKQSFQHFTKYLNYFHSNNPASTHIFILIFRKKKNNFHHRIACYILKLDDIVVDDGTWKEEKKGSKILHNS
jgi:hypothetical protein